MKQLLKKAWFCKEHKCTIGQGRTVLSPGKVRKFYFWPGIFFALFHCSFRFPRSTLFCYILGNNVSNCWKNWICKECKCLDGRHWSGKNYFRSGNSCLRFLWEPCFYIYLVYRKRNTTMLQYAFNKMKTWKKVSENVKQNVTLHFYNDWEVRTRSRVKKRNCLKQIIVKKNPR